MLLCSHPRATKVSNTRSACVFVKVALRDWLSRRAAIDERQYDELGAVTIISTWVSCVKGGSRKGNDGDVREL